MENRLTKIMAVLAVAGLMAAGPVAYAEDPAANPQTGKDFKRGGHEGFFKELNLTPEQRAKLKAQREAKKAESKAVREQMKAKMQELHTLIAKPETKRSDVNKLVNEVNALKGKMFSQMIDGVFAMKEVLTPEQFAKMEAKRGGKMSNRHGNWGKHQKGPGGPEGSEGPGGSEGPEGPGPGGPEGDQPGPEKA